LNYSANFLIGMPILTFCLYVHSDMTISKGKQHSRLCYHPRMPKFIQAVHLRSRTKQRPAPCSTRLCRTPFSCEWSGRNSR
jgi:hypothetical protein